MLKEWFAKAESRGAVGFAEVVVCGAGISRQATCASILSFGCPEGCWSELTPCFSLSKLHTACAVRMGSTWGRLCYSGSFGQVVLSGLRSENEELACEAQFGPG